MTAPVLVLANNLTPSETANLDRKFVMGFATEVGGHTSHTAILAGALEIPAVGVINVYNQTSPPDSLAKDIDLASILSDAGVDIQDVKDIKLAGISYRVTVPDPNTGRSIDNATVTAARGAGGQTPLITNFSQNVSAASSWTKAPLDPAGVTLINGILTDILVAAKNGTQVSNAVISYHVQGTSNPTVAITNFTWELRLDLSIVGSIRVKVLS